MRCFARRSSIDAAAQDVFDWHERPGAFERLTPPWERVRVLERSGGIGEGARVVLEVQAGPFRMHWTVAHRGCIPGQQFEDIQARGPFRTWRHIHRFLPGDPEGSVLEDEIEYSLPIGGLSEPLLGPVVEDRLARMFDYRHRITRADLASHAPRRGLSPLQILVSGPTGLVGSALVPFLTTGGHRVVRLSRRPARAADRPQSAPGPGASRQDPSVGPRRMSVDPRDAAGEPRDLRPGAEVVGWDPFAGTIDEDLLEGLDAVVHLAAENIGEGAWTAARKQRILESRVRGTRLLCEALKRRQRRPRVLISSSAVGFYGDRGEEIVDEGSRPGRGFLADVCRQWEEATRPAEEAGIRVVKLRTAVVLTPAGGALARMLPPFRLGVGGRLGSGRQYMSWIAIDDLVALILHAIVSESVSGPVNATAPNPVTNREFARVLGRVLRRPSILPVPAPALRLLFGEMAEETILAGNRAVPRRAIESGYSFRHPELEGALRHLFGRMVAP